MSAPPLVLTAEQWREYHRTGRLPGDPDPTTTPAREAKRERRRDEFQLQRAVVEWLHLVTPRLAYPWAAVPNGGSRNVVEAALMQSQGVIAGAPDIVFIAAGLELKTTRGSLSSAQRAFRAECKRKGVPYLVGRSMDEVISKVGEAGLIR